MWISQIKNFILELFFPSFCLGCQREGNYLCQDCESTLEISNLHQKYQTTNLSDLYFALSYQKPLIQNLIQKFKYQPFVKELAKPLSALIIKHFQLLENPPSFFGKEKEVILIAVPLTKKKLKQRGFNQAEEITKELSVFLNIPLFYNVLLKIKETLPQVELSGKERKENVKGSFFCQESDKIKGKKIILIDDVFTTGSTMEECARVLKQSGAKEVLAITIARE